MHHQQKCSQITESSGLSSQQAKVFAFNSFPAYSVHMATSLASRHHAVLRHSRKLLQLNQLVDSSPQQNDGMPTSGSLAVVGETEMTVRSGRPFRCARPGSAWLVWDALPSLDPGNFAEQDS